MKAPLFKVGEVVIRQAPSTNYPEANGEYTVLDIITVDEYRSAYPFVSFDKLSGGFYYKLAGLEILLKFSDTISCHTNEGFLRKKHRPSGKSFDKLMSSLKQPQKV